MVGIAGEGGFLEAGEMSLFNQGNIEHITLQYQIGQANTVGDNSSSSNFMGNSQYLELHPEAKCQPVQLV